MLFQTQIRVDRSLDTWQNILHHFSASQTLVFVEQKFGVSERFFRSHNLSVMHITSTFYAHFCEYMLLQVFLKFDIVVTEPVLFASSSRVKHPWSIHGP